MSERLIESDRSIIIADDVEPDDFENLVKEVGDAPGISGHKVGFEVALGLSLPKAVDIIHEHAPNAIAMYDHQKAANDIEATGKNFARAMVRGGVDAAILFPFTGPDVEHDWIKALQDSGIRPIVGAEMTVKRFRYSEGGRIADDALQMIFEDAVALGVTDFVVPGNKPDKVENYRRFFEREIGVGKFVLYAPGFIEQSGDISETGALAGEYFHGIIGTAIYANKEGLSRSDAATMLGAKILEQSTQN